MIKYSKILSILIIFIMIITLFINYDTTSAYANESTNLVEIDTYGNKTNGAPMFSEGLWAPGVEQSGIMRLNNNSSQEVKIHSLGLMMILEKEDGTIIEPDDTEGLYKKFAESMKLTITRGKMLVFKDTIYNSSFYGMLYNDGISSFKGFTIPTSDQFNINKNESTDLKYIVKMDESAGNELQGIKATVTFMVNINESQIDNKDKSDKKETVDEEVPQSGISDINGHWAEDCILKLINAGIVKGYPDGTIKPDNTISRAETAVLVSKALKLEEIDKVFTGYVDPIPKWARTAIITTSQEGIFEGYPILVARIFKPKAFITREEMATVLMRGFKLNSNSHTELLKFTDMDEISDWAMDHVILGIENNIIAGYPDTTFRPQENITRAEAFTMICKLLKLTSN